MRLFFLQLWGELVKMSARKRTYVGFAMFVAAEIAFLLIMNMRVSKEHIGRLLANNGLGFDEYFSWLSLAQMIRSFTIFMLGGIYLSLVQGDLVAKETEEGSFRLLMSRPISRLRILTLKFIAGFIYTAALVLFVTLSSWIVGLIYRGPGGAFLVWDGVLGVFAAYDMKMALWRQLVNLPFLIVSVNMVGAMAFMFSCFRMKPATAATLAFSVMTIDFILARLPMSKAYEPYALITHMGSHFFSFMPEIPWARLTVDYALLIGLQLTAFIIGWFGFQIRDFKS